MFFQMFIWVCIQELIYVRSTFEQNFLKSYSSTVMNIFLTKFQVFYNKKSYYE